MASRIISFMYHHCQFCLAGKDILPEPSPDTFTLFPFLPAELRLKIWQMIANTPRSVELICTPTSSYLPEGKWFSHSKSPVIFRICSDSRAVALSMYSTLAFSSDQLGKPCSMPLHINFAVDTLWLCEDLHVSWARDLLQKNEQLKDKLRYLSVKEIVWKELNATGTMPWPISEVQLLERLAVPKDGVFRGLRALENVCFHK